MGGFLVAGRAGSGKSTVAHELQRRGLAAFDSDEIPGLAQWTDVATGQPTTVEDYTLVDKTKTEWRWDEKVLAHFLATHNNVFLCGSADNDLTFHANFEKIFVLDVSPEVQARRLRTRTNSNYGKDPRMIATILHEQTAFVADARALGAAMIDADAPLEQVADEIVRRAQ